MKKATNHTPSQFVADKHLWMSRLQISTIGFVLEGYAEKNRVAKWAPGTIGMGNCFRTRIWSAGDAFLAPCGSRTLAPFFRPMAQTGARFFCASTVSSRMRVRISILAFGLI